MKCLMILNSSASCIYQIDEGEIIVFINYA